MGPGAGAGLGVFALVRRVRSSAGGRRQLTFLCRLDVQVNVGYGGGGFSFNESGLVSTNPEWGGWLGKLC